MANFSAITFFYRWQGPKGRWPSSREGARGSGLTRILERQNVLQTSQVLFRRICVSLAMVLPFKDSSEAAEPRCVTFSAIKRPNTPRWSEARPR